MKHFLFLTLFLTQLGISNLYGLSESDEKPSLEFIQTVEVPRSSGTVKLSIYKLGVYFLPDTHNSESKNEVYEDVYLSNTEPLDLSLGSVFESPYTVSCEYKKSFLLVKDPVSRNTVAQLGYEIQKNKNGLKNFYISTVWVEEPYRRIGISKLLLRMCEKLAVEARCDFLSLITDSTLKGAHKAYIKAGYSSIEFPLPPTLLEKGYFMYKALTKEGKEFLSK